MLAALIVAVAVMRAPVTTSTTAIVAAVSGRQQIEVLSGGSGGVEVYDIVVVMGATSSK